MIGSVLEPISKCNTGFMAKRGVVLNGVRPKIHDLRFQSTPW
jgi:hypothetical protein